jgi:hypothetical protein
VTTAKKNVKKTIKARKTSSNKKSSSHHGPEAKPAHAAVTVDRRANADRRNSGDRRKKDAAVVVERRVIERRAKVVRRRQIDPTTCERDYSQEELEFMNALDQYKRANGRMFPTCSEVLEVIRGLGYEKRPQNTPSQDATSELAEQQVIETTAV